MIIYFTIGYLISITFTAIFLLFTIDKKNEKIKEEQEKIIDLQKSLKSYIEQQAEIKKNLHKNIENKSEEIRLLIKENTKLFNDNGKLKEKIKDKSKIINSLKTYNNQLKKKLKREDEKMKEEDKKTGHELIKQLPKNIKKKFKANTDKIRGLKYLDRLFPNIYYLICCAFEWKKSNEGYDFWGKIANKYK